MPHGLFALVSLYPPDRGCRFTVTPTEPFGRQLVNVRSLDLRAIAAQVGESHVIRHDDEEVWSLRLRHAAHDLCVYVPDGLGDALALLATKSGFKGDRT